MERKKVPDRFRHQNTVAVNGTGTVESTPVDIGVMVACQSIAFRNQTGLRGNVEIYLKQQAVETFLCDQTTPAANRWYWYPYEQHLVEGEQIIARQATCLADDILDLHIIGYKTYGSEGEIV